MIYTITFAPSIDYVTYVDDFHVGELNRAEKVQYFAGGKGINISRLLKRFQCETMALGFVGGFSGQYVKDCLVEEGVAESFIHIDTPTRINVKLKARQETELNGPSPNLTSFEIEQLKRQLQEKLVEGDWLVISGSIPSTVEETFFAFISELCEQRNVKWVLDTSGRALASYIRLDPTFVKPNEHELAELVGEQLTTLEQVAHAAKKIVADGVQFVVVSLGSKGALCVTAEEVIRAESPKGTAVNTVGAGDSVVAAMTAKLMAGMSLTEAFQYGVAAGSATAFSEDLCQVEEVEALVSQVIIHKGV